MKNTKASPKSAKKKKTTLPIITLGHPMLRKKAKAVSLKVLASKKTQEFIDSLIHTGEKMKGIGIAATQVGSDFQIFIIASKPSERYPKAPLVNPTAIINPQILGVSGIMKADWEGCLSLIGIRGLVPRHTSIKVSFLDRDGKKHVAEFDDFLARVFQHEHDHLNGIMFIDRVADTGDLMSDEEYFKMMHARIGKQNAAAKKRKQARKK